MLMFSLVSADTRLDSSVTERLVVVCGIGSPLVVVVELQLVPIV